MAKNLTMVRVSLFSLYIYARRAVHSQPPHRLLRRLLSSSFSRVRINVSSVTRILFLLISGFRSQLLPPLSRSNRVDHGDRMLEGVSPPSDGSPAPEAPEVRVGRWPPYSGQGIAPLLFSLVLILLFYHLISDRVDQGQFFFRSSGKMRWYLGIYFLFVLSFIFRVLSCSLSFQLSFFVSILMDLGNRYVYLSSLVLVVVFFVLFCMILKT